MKSKVNEISLRYKNHYKLKNAPKISSSNKAAEIFLECWEGDLMELQECFLIMFLNNSNKVKGFLRLSKGGITGTLVDIRILFAVALKSLSTAIILAHNHPSGNLTPSESDKALTTKIKQAGEFMDIKVLDHIILIPDGNYFSFADEGLL